MKRLTLCLVLVALLLTGCHSPKTPQSDDLPDLSALKAYSLTKVDQSEYDGIESSFLQTFQQEVCTAEEMQKYVDAMLTDDDRIWLESSDLQIEAGRFMPMGMPAVRVVAPIDDLRRFHLGGMLYGRPIYADFAYALSPEGYFVGQVQDGNLHVTWSICRIEGYEQNDLPPIVFDGPGQADEFRWAPDGWLYFKIHEEHYKMHVDIPMTQNCRIQDVEVSELEFKDALMRADQENIIRSNRGPDAADTATLKAWAKWSGTSLDLLEEEPGYIMFEGFCDCIEIAIGDYCCTLVKGDTVQMESCGMALSADWPRYFGGVNMEYGAGEAEVPSYVYIYPLLPDFEHVGKPYIYQTTPQWTAEGRYAFWAADGWFYVEGYDRKKAHTVYHKLHLP